MRCNAKLLFLFLPSFLLTSLIFILFLGTRPQSNFFFPSSRSLFANNFVNASVWWWTMVTFRSSLLILLELTDLSEERKCAICMICKTQTEARTIAYSAMSGVSFMDHDKVEERKIHKCKWIWHNKVSILMWYAGWFFFFISPGTKPDPTIKAGLSVCIFYDDQTKTFFFYSICCKISCAKLF